MIVQAMYGEFKAVCISFHPVWVLCVFGEGGPPKGLMC